MTKFITIVVVIYIIYYAANIIYDIFFKKEKRTPDEEDKEEFAFNNIDDDVKVTNVGIDDVENMDMGETFIIVFKPTPPSSLTSGHAFSATTIFLSA